MCCRLTCVTGRNLTMLLKHFLLGNLYKHAVKTHKNCYFAPVCHLDCSAPRCLGAFQSRSLEQIVYLFYLLGSFFSCWMLLPKCRDLGLICLNILLFHTFVFCLRYGQAFLSSSGCFIRHISVFDPALLCSLRFTASQMRLHP